MSAHATGQGTPPHVLVVDDDGPIRDLIATVLGDEGYRVTALAHPPGVADVAALAPEVAILDYRIGAVAAAGSSLLARMRAEPATRAIPVVICTAAPREAEALVPGPAALGASVLAKPFDLDALLAAVAAALRRGREDRVIA
jgi:two-component system, OmpR family, response regulator MprA